MIAARTFARVYWGVALLVTLALTVFCAYLAEQFVADPNAGWGFYVLSAVEIVAATFGAVCTFAVLVSWPQLNRNLKKLESEL